MRYMAPGGGAVSTEEKGFGWGRVAQGRRALGGGEGRGREGYISKEGDGGVYMGRADVQEWGCYVEESGGVIWRSGVSGGEVPMGRGRSAGAGRVPRSRSRGHVIRARALVARG